MGKKKLWMKFADWFAQILLIVGGLNWFFTGFGLNLVNKLVVLIRWFWLENAIYILVGVSAVWVAVRVVRGDINLKN